MSVLTHSQEVFAKRLAAKTGLDLNVIRAWALAEESGHYAIQREQQGNNNVLNVGYYDSGTADFAKHFGDPIAAADLTARFLKGEVLHPGGRIPDIIKTAGMPVSDQLHAIAVSGWASSGYRGGTALMSTYNTVSGHPAPDISTTAPKASSSSDTPSLPLLPGMPQGITQASLSTSAEPFLVRHTISLPNFDGSPPIVSSLNPLTIPPPPVESPLNSTPKPSPFTAPTNPVTGKPSPVSVPPGQRGKTGTFEGTTVAAWMVPALQYARANGWKGKLTSGVRTTAEQAVLYQRYKAGGNIAAKPGQSNHEIQNGGAFDATDAPQLNSILAHFTGKRPIWAKSVGLDDTPHFSSTGR